MDNRGGLAVYVTSHGFGHLNRTAAVLNRLPADLPLVIRGHPGLFDHWRERLHRPARLEPHVSDAGAVNPPGDSAATDIPATIALASRVHAEAMERVDRDAQTLRDEGTAAVLCDAPAPPLVASHRAGVPGLLLCNFTWADIYAPMARALGGDAPRLVADLRRAYRRAAAVFRAEPAVSMRWLPRQVPVGLVVTPGRDRRVELRQDLGISPSEKIVYFYIGRYGQADLGWERLRALSGVHFVGFHPAPVGLVPNLHVVAADSWNGADLAASADAIVAKAGYGTACEAMAAGTPLIYPPRFGFAEHRALDRALRSWGGGLPASTRQFAEFRLRPLLDRAFSLRPGPPPFPADGAARVASQIVQICESR
ncbi:MAG TPA: hypothetical protein VG406_11970 [Isosphaeraceae bacterium]|jgi:hypothetical protein|nr:hypothetical protein [Isosphaeraceae bacterium]